MDNGTPEVDQSEIVRVLAPLAWRAAGKMFKLISWAAIVAALNFTATRTSSHPVQVLASVASLVFAATLLLQASYLAVRDPGEMGVPETWHWFARPVQNILALALLFALTGPYLFLDQIIDALGNAKLK